MDLTHSGHRIPHWTDRTVIAQVISDYLSWSPSATGRSCSTPIGHHLACGNQTTRPTSGPRGYNWSTWRIDPVCPATMLAARSLIGSEHHDDESRHTNITQTEPKRTFTATVCAEG